MCVVESKSQLKRRRSVWRFSPCIQMFQLLISYCSLENIQTCARLPGMLPTFTVPSTGPQEIAFTHHRAFNFTPLFRLLPDTTTSHWTPWLAKQSSSESTHSIVVAMATLADPAMEALFAYCSSTHRSLHCPAGDLVLQIHVQGNYHCWVLFRVTHVSSPSSPLFPSASLAYPSIFRVNIYFSTPIEKNVDSRSFAGFIATDYSSFDAHLGLAFIRSH